MRKENKLPQIYLDLASIFKDNGYHLFMVGGTSRDYLLNKEILDFDFTTDATIEEMKKFLNVNESFISIGSMSIEFEGTKVDITTLREEGEYLDYRHPSKVNYVKEPKLDSFRRDFTINAIYIDKDDNILDFHNGLNDLDKGIIKMIGDPYIRLKEDPLRILRCLRFALILDYQIEEALKDAIKENTKYLKELTLVKCYNEINKMINFNKEKALAILLEYQIDLVLPLIMNINNPLNCIDMHSDTLTRELNNGQTFLHSNYHIDISKLYAGEYLMQCFAVFIYLKEGTSPFVRAVSYFDKFDKLMDEYSYLISPVRNYKELMDNKSKHKMCALLTTEEGEIIEGKLENLEYLYSRGVRMFSLTWNFINQIGYPNFVTHVSNDMLTPDTKNGLTPFGIEVVKKCNELGIIIDVSHLNDAGFYDVIKYSTKPIVASHSNSRSVCNNVRNLTDDMILALHKNGGLMGMNYCPDFVSNNQDKNQIEDIVKHMIHIKELGCIDSLGLGSDFDGIPTPNGMSDASKTIELVKEMKKQGFTQEEIEKVMYKNFLRVFKKVCKN